MTEQLLEEKVEDKVYQISENYAIGADAYNVTLYEKFNKMSSRGKGGVPTGETGWRPAKCGAYYSNLEYLSNSLKNKVEKETIDAVGFEFDKFTTYMDNWLVDLKSHMNEHITLVLGKVKEITESEEKDGKKK